MSTDISKKIEQATKWSSITEIVSKLISPIVNIMLARLLVPEAFGIVATITMVISFAEIFTDAGFQKYIIQHEFKDTYHLNKSTDVAFWTNLILSSLIFVLIFIFQDSVANFVGSPELGNSISIASILIIIAAFSSIQMARYKRDFDFKTLFFVRVGTTLIPLLITVPLAFIMRNYWALLIGNFVSQLFSAVVLTIKSKWKPSFFYSFKLLKEMFSFSAWSLLESISIWLTNYIGVFIVGNYLSDYYLGIYKTSMSTVNSYMAIITGAVTPVLFSALSRYQNNDTEFKKTYFRFQRIAAVFAFPMGLGIYIFRDLVTYFLLGSQWMDASGFIGLWGMTSAIVIVFSHFSSEVYRSKANPNISLFSQLIHLAFIIPSLLISVNYGFKALYTVSALIRIQCVLSAFIIMKVLYKFEICKTIKNIFPVFLSSIIMCAVGLGLKRISGNILWQFTTIFICIIVYFAVLLGCFPKIRREVYESKFGKILTNKKD